MQKLKKTIKSPRDPPPNDNHSQFGERNIVSDILRCGFGLRPAHTDLHVQTRTHVHYMPKYTHAHIRSCTHKHTLQISGLRVTMPSSNLFLSISCIRVHRALKSQAWACRTWISFHSMCSMSYTIFSQFLNSGKAIHTYE